MGLFALSGVGVGKEWISSEFRVNVCVCFAHFGVTSGIARNPRVIPGVAPEWVGIARVRSRFARGSLDWVRSFLAFAPWRVSNFTRFFFCFFVFKESSHLYYILAAPPFPC